MRVMAISNYAKDLANQFTVYSDFWDYNGNVTLRFRNIQDGTVVANKDVALENIMLIFY